MNNLAVKGTRAALLLLAVTSLSACGIVGGGKNKGPKTPVVGERVSILNTERDAEADPALATVPVILPAPYANSEWTQPGGNAAKLIGHVALSASPSQAWGTSISGVSVLVAVTELRVI